jgi:hypothetical protein
LSPSPVGGWTTDAAVTVATSTTSSGRLHVVHNWGWERATAVPATDVTDLLSGEEYERGTSISLGPWDVRVLSDGLHRPAGSRPPASGPDHLA